MTTPASRPSRRSPTSLRTRTRLFVEQLEAREVLATISGAVFVGLDVADPMNQNPNPGMPVSGAIVSLDNGVQTVTTGANGAYSFANVPAANHTVTVQPPPGFVGFSAQGLNYSIVVDAAQTFPNLNFALTPKSQAVVQNLYELVLGRPADAVGFNALVQQLNNGSSVGAAFRTLLFSSEFQTKVQPIASMLGAFFPGTPIDIGQFRNAVQLQNLGVSIDATVLNILYSQEFVARFGDTSQLSNSQFVTFAYQRLLRLNPTTAQRNALVNQLNSGAINRGEVLLDLINTRTFRSRQANVVRGVAVSVAYLGVLGREATATEFVRDVRRLRAGLSAGGLANWLTRSNQFRTLPGYTDTFLWDVQTRPLTPAVALLSRLQLYNPQTQAFDTAVTTGSLTSTAGMPSNVYFIAHGWAPGYEEDVLLHSTPGNPLKVWQTIQFPGGFPTPGPDSPWLFQGVNQVSAQGLAQAIVEADPRAKVVVYSWIDESATPASGNLGLDNLTPILYVSQSEAQTQLNGLRLAEAIRAALSPTFFSTGQGLIHVMGHSHGSKVATVATLALQQTGVPVTQLTTLESAEAGPAPNIGGFQLPPLHLPGLGNGQNFNWYFMQQMQLTKNPVTGRTPAPPIMGQFPTFIDNYFSQDGFGQALGGYPGLGNLVDVLMHPEVLYPLPTSTSDPDFDTKLLDTLFGSHDYPPAWYAQASIQQVNPPNAMGWSPLLNDQAAAALNGLYAQTWTQPVFAQQFALTPNGTAPPTYTPTFTPLQYARQYSVGQTTDNGSTMSLSVGANNSTSIQAITFNPQAATTGINGNGLDFQVQFNGVDPGEQVELVIWVRGLVGVSAPIASINEGTLGYFSIPVFAMTGGDAGTTARTATISLDGFLSGVQSAPVLGPFSASQLPILGFSLVGSAGSTATVTISNLRQFNDGVNG